MKLFLVCTVLSLFSAAMLVLGHPSGVGSEPNPLTSAELESLLEVSRPKRSGSSDFISGIKKGILHAVGHASASSAGASSSKSSKSNSHGDDPHNYDPYDHNHGNHGHDGKEATVDALKLKKQILHTLFQAVKAVTGGVAALKGQLIKGSGYVVSKGGKLIQASGDGVTHVGKKLINSAKVQDSHEDDHHHHHHHPPSAADYEVHNHYSSHSGPSGYAYAPVSPVYYPHTAYGPPKGEAYHASTSNHISGSEDLSFAKLPYPVPFKSPAQQLHQDHQHHQSSSAHVTLDAQLPVNVGGQAAFDFISSYEPPASGLHSGNSLGAAAFSGSASPASAGNHGGTSANGHSSTAVEALREILNKNIPYTDPTLINPGPAIDVEFSDQGLGQGHHHDTHHTQTPHDTLASTGFGGYDTANVNHFQTQHQPDAADSHYPQQPGADSNPVHQYDIPPDPKTYVPAFKPLSQGVQPFMRYGVPPVAVAPVPVVPVQSVYSAHSIHTAYGPPPAKYFRPTGTNNGGGGGGVGLGPVGYKNTVPHRPGNAYLPPVPQQGPYTRRTLIGGGGKMHGKRMSSGGPGFNRPNGAFNGGLPGGPLRLSPVLPTPVPLRSAAPAVADQQPEHEVQVQRLQDSLGLDIEVQKSISIELDGKGNVKPKETSSPVSGQNRRSSVVVTGEDVENLRPLPLPVATGPIYSRPYSKRRLTHSPKKYTFHRF